eukprot:365681-Chlamydomonas_euryale.AAC.10
MEALRHRCTVPLCPPALPSPRRRLQRLGAPCPAHDSVILPPPPQRLVSQRPVPSARSQTPPSATPAPRPIRPQLDIPVGHPGAPSHPPAAGHPRRPRQRPVPSARSWTSPSATPAPRPVRPQPALPSVPQRLRRPHLAVRILEPVQQAELGLPAEISHSLVDRREKVLVAHRKRLLLAKIEVLGVEVHKVGLGRAHREGACLGKPVKRDVLLPRDVVDLVECLHSAHGKSGAQQAELCAASALH